MFGEKKNRQDPEDELAPVPTSDMGEMEECDKPDTQQDAIFGEVSKDGPNYRDVSDSTSLWILR